MSNNNLSPTVPVMSPPSPSQDTGSNPSLGPGTGLEPGLRPGKGSGLEPGQGPGPGPGPGGTSLETSIVEKLSDDVKNWKDETRQELFKRSISESPDISKTGNRDLLGGSTANLSAPGCPLTNRNPAATGSKFGSTFSIIKHKRVELTTYSDER